MKKLSALGLFRVFALCMGLANTGYAETQDQIKEASFTAGHWTTGLHLMAGLGFQASYFESDVTRRRGGLGLNIQTDLSYAFFNDFAFEASTNVMFNQVKRVLIWNTLSTLGLRVRLPTYIGPAHSYPYFRIAAGRGPSVFIAKGQKSEAIDLGGGRAQIEGDVFGLAYGIFQNARDGTTWFLELGATVNSYRSIEAIKDVEDVPEVIYSRSVSDHSAMYAMSLTFGVVVF